MDLKEVKSLISIVEKANISSFSIEEDNMKIEIKKEKPEQTFVTQMPAQVSASSVAAPAPAQTVAQDTPAAAPVVDEGLEYVISPMVGTYYSSPSPDAAPFIKVGDKVSQGQVVCIVEAMKLFNEIECDYSGTVEKIFVNNSDPVEYGQKIIAIKPN